MNTVLLYRTGADQKHLNRDRGPHMGIGVKACRFRR